MSLYALSEQKKLSAEIVLSSEEIDKIVQRSPSRYNNVNLDAEIPRNSNFTFEGTKPRTKEQLQMLMYTDEMDAWLAEARQEEANGQARIQAALLRESLGQPPQNDGDSRRLPDVAAVSGGSFRRSSAEEEAVQVVGEGDDALTTIHRPVLPDLN